MTITRAPLIFLASCLSFLITSFSRAAIRVDLSPDNGRHDVMTPEWENWRIKDGGESTQSFGPITVHLRPSKGTLTTFFWKGGLDTGATMSCDGVSAAELQLVLTGLTPGHHALVTYHNSPQISAPAMEIAATGKLSNVQSTSRVQNDADAAFTFIEFDAIAGQDAVFTIRPTSGNVAILNGFAIDVANPATLASKPTPNHNDEHVVENPVLAWTAPQSAVAHEFYLGTSAESVAAATPSSAEFKGSLVEAKFQTQNLNTDDTYFWRVDEVLANKSKSHGDIWRFRVRHLAFPGAEGYGRFALGGRGGKVYEVTTLDDYVSDKNHPENILPGSLRAAVEAEGPRTVVFKIGGTIQLKEKLVVHNPYITVAGQTAPGDGICIRGATFGNLSTHDSIIRYVRVRVGDESGKTYDGMGFANSDNCIIDHCSISWTIDESVSSRSAKNITFQRNLIAEALNMSVHSHYVGTGKGHSFAGSISGDIGSYHHNLLAHCAGRNWSLAGGLTQGGNMAGYLDIRNNVVYNWQHRTNDGGVKSLNLVNNYYIPGPASRVFHLLMPDTGKDGDPQLYYVAGNMMEGRPQYDADNWKNGGVISSSKLDPKIPPQIKLDKPFCEPFVATQSAKGAYDNVMADVGCNYPHYDKYDLQMISDVKKRTATYSGSKTHIPGIIDSQTDAGGWPELKSGPAPMDSDHDGIPDDWEKSRGLNPNDPTDGAKDAGDGYTNLEHYLNDLVAR
jgi:hypothetical protein